jgi:hypothetical protein
MDRAQILEFYKVDGYQYQGTCAVIGLENPVTLTGEQLDHFDRVRGWLDSREVHTFDEASDRFKAEAEQKPKAVSDELLKSFTLSAQIKADSAMDEVLSVLQKAESKVQKKALQAFYARAAQIAQSPEYQEKLRQACEGETIEADFSPDGGDGSGLASIAAIILHQQLMIFCHKHRAVLQTRADSLNIRERQLKQQLHYKEQTLKTLRQLTRNIFVVVGALSLVAVLGAISGINYPAAITCTKGDAICSLRFRGGVVQLNQGSDSK